MKEEKFGRMGCRNDGKALLGLVAAGMMTLIILISGAASAQPVGEIVIPAIHDLSGPYNVTCGPTAEAYENIQGYINETGGIRGKKLKIIQYDNRYDATLTTSIYNRLMSEAKKPILIMSNTSGVVVPLKTRLAEDQVPLIQTGANIPLTVPPGWVFCIMPVYSVSHSSAIEALMADWGEKRKPILYITTIDNPTGHELLKLREWIKGKNIEYAGHDFIPLMPMDVTVYMDRIQKANPDWIISILTEGAYTPLIKEMNARKMKARLIVPLFPGLDILEKQVGLPLLENVYMITCYAPNTAVDQPGVKVVVERCRKPPQKFCPPNPMYMGGWASGMVAKQAIEMAVDKVGWEKITGKDVFRALKEGTFDFGGLLPALTYGETNRASLKNILVRLDKNGKEKTMTPWVSSTFIPSLK